MVMPQQCDKNYFVDNNSHDNLEITGVTDFLLLEELEILPIATFAYHLENMPERRLLEQQPGIRINGIS
jgi:hypothetical protein